MIATVAGVLLAVAGNAQTILSGTIAGHDYVDLGLSVKWATCNVGASSPEGYGDYFAWGETRTKSSYTCRNSKTIKTKSIGDIEGNPKYDVARVKWCGPWRLPTMAEMYELIDECTWTWTTQGGHNGYKVTSKTNGNSIFLPAAGWRERSSLISAGEFGYYWSSAYNPMSPVIALCIYFNDGLHDMTWYGRPCGFSVRPVSD